MKYNPFPQYKSSGVEWLGDVPEHWEIFPLKRIVSIPITDGPHETPEILDEGVPFISAESIRGNKIDFSRKRGYISIEDHHRFSLKYKPKRNDIYMIKSGATTGNLAIVETDEDFAIWSPLAVIRSDLKKSLPKYLMSAMNSKEFQTSVQLFWSFGTQQNIGMDVIENLVIPLPPLPEQKDIAAFLDRETGRIDALVAKKKRLVELLREKRTALISRAVTKGLDLSVKMKPSGVEWLDDIPEHWEIVPFKKYVAEQIDYRGATPEKVDEGIFLVTAKNIKMGFIDYECLKEFVAESEFALIMRRGLPKIGDILFTTEAPLGNVALVTKEDIALAQRVIRFRMNIEYLNSYSLYLMISPFFQCQLSSLSTGSTAEGIKASKLSKLFFIKPPLSEQQAIAAFLDRETGKIDALIAKVETVIEKLNEYRIALISAAVTGKIDVRNK